MYWLSWRFRPRSLHVFFVSATPAHAQGGWPETPDETWATNGAVFDTALSDDEKTLYVAGNFTVVRENPPGQDGDRVGRQDLAAIDTTSGEVIRSWKPKTTGTDNSVVRSIEVENGKVYFGGGFTEVNGEPRKNVAAVDAADGSLVSGFDPEVTHTNADVEPRVFTILTSDSKVYIGGRFNRVDGKWRQNIAALDSTTGELDLGWDPKANREVFDLEFAADEQTVFAIGRFGKLIGSDGAEKTRKNVGRLHTDTGNLHPWTIPEGDIQTIVAGDPTADQTGWEGIVTPNRLYAAFGDKGPNYAAAFKLDNGNTGNRIWKQNVVGDVYSLALTPDGKRLFFGGHFGINRHREYACGNMPVQGIGSLNPENGRWLCDWIPQLQPEFKNGYGPWEMTMIGNDQLWVSGGFTHVSGVEQTNLARFTYDPDLKPLNQKPRVDLNGFRSGGLDAAYFDTTGSRISRVDKTVNFDFGNGSPDPKIDSDKFNGRWKGQIKAPVSGKYTFTTRSDDGVRLFVEGETVIDEWVDQGPTNNSGTVTLEAGKRYDIALDYYENRWGAEARLSWAYPGQAKQIIPASNLFYSGGTGFSAEFSANGPTPIVNRSRLNVFDADDLNLKFATARLTNRPDGNAESLSADTSGTPTVANYYPASGILRITGEASKADYEKVLRTVSYENTAQGTLTENRKVTFRIGDGHAYSNVARSIIKPSQADTAKPAIWGVNPRGEIRDKTPTIRATIRDRDSELKKANIKLYLDGRQIKRFAYNQDRDRLSRTTGRLSKGMHWVKIVAVDKSGNRAVKLWKFRVTR